MNTTSTPAPSVPVTAWFAAYACTCSALTPERADVPATCPTHDARRLHSPEHVTLADPTLPMGLAVHAEGGAVLSVGPVAR